jgi:hypothetical protein
LPRSADFAPKRDRFGGLSGDPAARFFVPSAKSEDFPRFARFVKIE